METLTIPVSKNLGDEHFVPGLPAADKFDVGKVRADQITASGGYGGEE